MDINDSIPCHNRCLNIKPLSVWCRLQTNTYSLDNYQNENLALIQFVSHQFYYPLTNQPEMISLYLECPRLDMELPLGMRINCGLINKFLSEAKGKKLLGIGTRRIDVAC